MPGQVLAAVLLLVLVLALSYLKTLLPFVPHFPNKVLIEISASSVSPKGDVNTVLALAIAAFLFFRDWAACLAAFSTDISFSSFVPVRLGIPGIFNFGDVRADIPADTPPPAALDKIALVNPPAAAAPATKALPAPAATVEPAAAAPILAAPEAMAEAATALAPLAAEAPVIVAQNGITGILSLLLVDH
jgi:hypothetical protein